ncbi:hypothetical protein EDB83DRAFT_2311578 [Lactarius deliciosus]|nr:hypothetical protein EDB83DRAFT_2311578 [Lactarius deliciosus]
MEPNTPPASDSHPSIPVSHPRSSPRSSASSSSSQPPISPPRPSAVTPTATQTTLSCSLVAGVPEAAAPPMSRTILSNSAPIVQPDPEAPGVPAVTKADSNEPRVPNVYINGLPPNFPEEQLYALTKDFGGVVSVRTFTRHVSDRPSGYGFVLCVWPTARYYSTRSRAPKNVLKPFDGIETSTRPFARQNFHPIPGTRYASLSSPSPEPSLSSPTLGTDGDTFKSRMERLKDEGSTNLYIEGLPLSIDEPTMAALVAPYTIKSSRFFQTRLSHPPRTIAFVRLETRAACEDVIKRLHGRMVRGWNDHGSRISVRFADSAEQRELRRSERSGRGDDSPPARLTMAQAALLNLRGQQVQGHLRVQQHLTTLSDQHRIQSAQVHPNPHDLSSMHHQHARLPPHPVVSQSQSEPENLTTSHPVSTHHLQGRTDTETPVGLSAALGSDIDLSALSRAAGANGFTPLEQQLILQARLQAELDARRRPFYSSQGSSSLSGGSTHTPSVLIDQTEGLSRSLNNLGLRSTLPPKEFVPRATATRITHPQTYNPAHSSRLSADMLPSQVADNYHASKLHQSQSLPFPSCQQQQHGVTAINSRILGLTSKDGALTNHRSTSLVDKDCTGLPSNPVDFVPDSAEGRGSTQREEQQNLAAHMRSTTLPPHFTVGSSSIAHNTGTVNSRLNGILSPTLHSGAGIGDRGHVGKLNIGIPSSELPINREIDPLPSDVKLMHLHNLPADSPFLIPSPALTYNSSSSASSRTPSTLSPSTPFFGSFPHPGDSFGTYNGEEHGGDKTDAAITRDVAAFDIGTQIRSGSG